MADPKETQKLMDFLFRRSVEDLQARVENLYDSLPTEEEYLASTEAQQEECQDKCFAINSLLEEWVLDEEDRQNFSPF